MHHVQKNNYIVGAQELFVEDLMDELVNQDEES